MKTIAEQNLAQAAEQLKLNDIDLWLIYSGEGSDPAVELLTGLETIGRTFFLFTKDSKRYVISTVIDAQEYDDSRLFDEVIRYQGEPAEALIKLVTKINPSKIALNYSPDERLCDGLTVGRYRYLKKLLGDFESRFVSSENMLANIRAVKTSGEIELIKRAVSITDEIFDEALAGLRPGMTEAEMGELFLDGMRKRGVSNSSTRALTGPKIMKESADDLNQGGRVLTPGDCVLIDFGVVSEGYSSALIRTAYVLKDGETAAPQYVEKAFKAVYTALTTAIEYIRPGVAGYEAEKVIRDSLLSQGIKGALYVIGRQTGMYADDGGAVIALKDGIYGNSSLGIIGQDMVFGLGVVLTLENGLCVGVKEEILVTENGAELLTNRQNEPILLSSGAIL